jgi:crotonobetainyl-CoA:carnitine CoA-transferase CaiB-like acyl-CoA transferase
VSELLAGVRVIESATLFNGDHLGAILGDLGADVIKVESPFQGDYLRDFLGQITPHNSPAHLQINKNKRSVAIDLRDERGREAFWKLLATADVFVDGNAADACAKLGIGYKEQLAQKADIIYCQYSGFGSHGPYAPIPTHGQMMNALAGATPRRMGADGLLHPDPDLPPMGGAGTGGEGTAAGAVHAALHVAAALTYRHRTGLGTFIDVAGTDGVIAQAWISSIYELNDGRIADRSSLPATEGGDPTGAKYQFYECRDGKAILFCCIEPKFWRNFCRAAKREDLLAAHRKHGRPVDFGGDETELRRELQHIFHERDLADWVELAALHDIPMAPAYQSVVEAAGDAHIRSRGIIHAGDHPDAGPFTYIGEAAKVADQPYKVRYPAPRLGQHTSHILGEVGVTAADIDALAADGIIL